MDLTNKLIEKINTKKAVIGVVGLGYVGLPLSLEFSKNGFKTIGFDIDEKKIPILNKGKSYIKHIKNSEINNAVKSSRFSATSDFSKLSKVDAIIICVPTPLNEHREPNLSYIENTAALISKYLRKGQLVSLESTTYPGTTEEVLLPMLENAPRIQNGKSKNIKKFIVGKDFFLSFSPEREDPNNKNYKTATIPKVVGGVTKNCLRIAQKLYSMVVIKAVPVSSTRAAEATKLLENIYRSVNIALVNELKMVFDSMNIDIWEVIEAAGTKPFGFNPFYPGPGLGGHCIPIDPFYLTWKAREYDINTKFIELAGEINTFQPYYVVNRALETLNKFKKTLSNARVLILGVAYKKDIDDMRESPSLKLIDILQSKGAKVDYHDPFIPKLPPTRKYKFEMKSVKLDKKTLEKYDLAILSTDHSNFDYKLIAEHANIILDTRNVFKKNGILDKKIYKA